MQIHFLILDRAPQPFRKNVVEGSSFPIHTYLDMGGLQQSEILRTGEMASLITVPNDRNGFCSCTLDSRQDKGQFQRLIQFPTHHIPRVPIQHSYEIHPAA
jgi:hypothetical protein